jgi:hypothetical protein
MHPIEMLLRAVNDGHLLGPETFADIASEEILAKRDSPEFEREWLRLFDQLKDTILNQDQVATLKRLRETAFKAAFRYTADADLSGYVSDDFELIAKGVTAGKEDNFLNTLLESYSIGRIPDEGGLSAERSIPSLLNDLASRER